MPNINAIALVVLAGTALAASIPAASPTARPWAQPGIQAEASSGISVTGEGSAPVETDRVEVRISVKSKAMTPGDALRAFEAKKALFEKAAAGFEGVEIRTEGTRVGLETSPNQAFMFDGNPQAAPKFEVSEVMTLTLAATGSDVKTVVELIDEAGDVDCEVDRGGSDPLTAIYLAQAGKVPEEPTAIRYLPSEGSLATAKTTAMELAFRDAKAQADAAATIAGVKVGPVQAIRIVQPFQGTSSRAGSAEGTVRIAARFAIL